MRAWFRVATLVVTLFLIEGAQSLERLGDVFSGYMAFETKGFDRLEKKIEKQETGHKPSIALQYVQQAHHAYDLGVMCNISKALGEKTSDLPDAADVVVHLRLGDVLKDDPVRDPWNSKAKLAYVKNRTYYEEALKNIPPAAKVEKVVLVFAFHLRDRDHQPSLNYIEHVEDFFTSRGYTVMKRTNGTVDSDFIYMSHAQFYIFGGGGYSCMTGLVVKCLGGHTAGELGGIFRTWESKCRHHSSNLTGYFLT
mmetsp:Transcript_64679/g.145905  ORF Transcript_64679/g.145905 Transcript_64679/m.145905 type:complete len:252 (-) Transcript_64679:312-1067(-)|eukprot:CAMPEP_0172590900 /NCGR_PEP_ID=MMETSP1068-20121228/9582_1 /TAXON_ID=35684 /ORGANISM="Pseudopedinella elastica, Strain CCMP716" /LENGTH=251 /DNA_ID=CAMNT_0013387065 /DNA_START=103 /DNA_END=858 /DNA_ORIENTATION=-